MRQGIKTLGLWCITAGLLALPFVVQAAPLPERLAGRILINTERAGEAWYVNPADLKRYYLGRPADAFAVMRRLGLGVAETDFQKIAQAGLPLAGDTALAKKLSGRIILQAERAGEAWYVNPADLKKYYLGRPADAFAVMRRLGLGVRRSDLARIHKPGMDEAVDQYSRYERLEVKTPQASFAVDLVTIDLANPGLEIVTAAATSSNCKAACPAKPLLDYVKEEPGAFAAINGTYFDTSAAKKNYYFFPVHDSRTGKLVNEDQLKWWTTGPIMAFDQNNKFYYFKDSREFGSVAAFENRHGVKLQAAIGNKPRLIENGLNVLIDWEVDAKQRNGRSTKGALAYKQGKLYLANVYKATVPDLGQVLEALGMEYALNLDGGYSTALFYNDELMAGPGRDIPNAIIFTTKAK